MGRTFTEQEITTALMAVVAWAGNCTAAARSLEAKGELHISPVTLNSWTKEVHADRYQEMREKYAHQLEQQAVADMRDVVKLSLDAQRLALEKTMERLESGKDQDPSRTAANTATVADKMTAKMLAMTGRPTQIREDRNMQEVMRSLVAMGVLSLPAAPEATDGTAKDGE